MNLKVYTTPIAGVLILEPRSYGDERGFFMESFNQKEFNSATGLDVQFVQDNHSRSGRGVLRGLHYQKGPHAQGKLVRVVRGSVFDVAADINRNSPTYGKWVGIELSEDNQRQLWIPAGLAHGFLVTSESADFLYKTTTYYEPSYEGAIIWNDPDLAIEWPVETKQLLISDKDRVAPTLQQLASSAS